ncbi:MAG: cytochrome C [Methylococcaceae bacterium]
MITPVGETHHACPSSRYISMIDIFFTLLRRCTRPARQLTLLLALCLVILVPMVARATNDLDITVIHPVFPLLDENGKHVLESGLPYSTRKSCEGSGCHDYDKITHGFHFEQGPDETDDDYGKKRGDKIPKFGFKGLSSLVGPGYFGGYNCMQGSQTGVLAKKVNTNVNDFGEWGAAGFIKACSSCHMGGGWEEKDRDGIRYDLKPVELIADKDGDYFERDKTSPAGLARWDWQKSGVREADCLTCHANFSNLKKFPASQLGGNDGKDGTSNAFTHWGLLQDGQFINKGFFRYANSAMLEFLNLKPDTTDGLQLLRVDRTITPNTPQPSYTLNLNEQGQPKLIWNKDAFDAQGNVLMPMYRFPNNDNCMMCHLASSGINRISSGKSVGSRRGFYGFGVDSVQTLNPDGTRVADFKDDVHKGKVWLDDSGESREIQTCVACHSKEYYKPASIPMELSPDHQFLKGNTDSDIRHDLTNAPKPLECDYCHDTAKSPSLPSSGEHTALDAHRELWKQRGYMEGYMPATYDKVVQVHFDQITCQACHITNVAYNDKPGEIHYRNRIDHDGKMKVVPYKPHTRYFAQDKTSGRILSRYETQSVLARKTDATGVAYGAIIDPQTQQEAGRVSINAMGQLGDPVNYDGYKILKQIYDKLLDRKGYKNPDVKLIYTETNEYILNHQTRPAKESVPCGDCHEKDTRGVYRAAVSDDGIFGRNKLLPIGSVPDRRLVDEGIFVLGKPYYQIDSAGTIKESVAAVLEASAINPSMSILNAENTREIIGYFKTADYADGTQYARISSSTAEKISKKLNSSHWLVFNSEVGEASLSKAAMIMPGDADRETRMRSVKVTMKSRASNKADVGCAANLGVNEIKDVYTLTFQNQSRKVVANPSKGDILIKLPYTGSMSATDKLSVAYSATCKSWQKFTDAEIVDFSPVTAEGSGYVVVQPTAAKFAKVKNLAIVE